MRARAEAEDLAIGRRSRGRAAARVGDRTDRRGLPVSVPLREGARAERMRAGSADVGRSAGLFTALFSFSFSFLFKSD
jgi:hypothetical protein